MKICLITDAPYCFDIRLQRSVSVLDELGYKITVIDQGFYREQSLAVLGEGKTLKGLPVPQAGFKKALWHVKNRLSPLKAYQERSEWVTRTIIESGADIIHCVNPMLIEAAMIAAEELKAKLIYEAYEYWPEYLFMQGGRIPEDLASYLKDAEKDASGIADVFITVSEPLARWYEEEQGFSNSKVIYNANVISKQSYEPGAFEPPLKVVFSGNLFQSRNVAVLLEAGRITKQPFKMFIVGEGPEKEFLLEHATSLKDQKADVTFIDAIPPSELIGFLSQMDVGVHLLKPNNKQSDGAVPNKYFDYMRAGVGIISADSSGARSLENYEDFMLLLPEISKEALAAALDSLMDDPARVERMRQAAYRAGDTYSSSRAAAELKEIYESLSTGATL